MLRRDWIRRILASGMAAGLPSLTFSAPKIDWGGNRILFQGDSITDGGRNREETEPNRISSLGAGYVFHTAGRLLREHPERQFEIFNRGISGNKVFQLDERWEDDCLAIKPGLLSILIGVNDYWHARNGNYDGTSEVYENDLDALLKRTRDALGEIPIVIGEPFIVMGGSAVGEDWYPEFGDYQAAALRMAKKYNAGFIPYQAYFDEALKTAPASYWCPDGVHPSIAGAVLMAEAWQETFRRM